LACVILVDLILADVPEDGQDEDAVFVTPADLILADADGLEEDSEAAAL
jgi:hypothetical protein